MFPALENSSSIELCLERVLQKMLCREHSAVRAYTDALSKIRTGTPWFEVAELLSRILDDHLAAVRDLTGWLADISVQSSACTTESMSGDALRDPQTALGLFDNLIREESLGERLYRTGVEDADLSDRFRFLLASKLLAGRQRNRTLLESAAASALAETAAGTEAGTKAGIRAETTDSAAMPAG